MEFVRVSFHVRRTVNVDHAPQGFTGDIITLGAGIHRFDLGVPVDYAPATQRLPVAGTSFQAPLEISFAPAAMAVVGPPAPAAPTAAKKKKKKKAAAKKKAAPKRKKTAVSTKKRARKPSGRQKK